jgi:hypothetical protein
VSSAIGLSSALSVSGDVNRLENELGSNPLLNVVESKTTPPGIIVGGPAGVDVSIVVPGPPATKSFVPLVHPPALPYDVPVPALPYDVPVGPVAEPLTPLKLLPPWAPKLLPVPFVLELNPLADPGLLRFCKS